ncbi:MAG: hypothetical protein DBP00_16870, partial [gamma proteobacterium symbiont of Ctena orbiculata]
MPDAVEKFFQRHRNSIQQLLTAVLFFYAFDMRAKRKIAAKLETTTQLLLLIPIRSSSNACTGIMKITIKSSPTHLTGSNLDCRTHTGHVAERNLFFW